MSIAVRTGLEPATPCVTGMYSNQLNYRTIDSCLFQLASAKIECFFGLCNSSAKKMSKKFCFARLFCLERREICNFTTRKTKPCIKSFYTDI